jgi:hypothetical protein
MKNYKNEDDEESNDYGFFCDLEENIETAKKYNKEPHCFIPLHIPNTKSVHTQCIIPSLKVGLNLPNTKISNSKYEKYKYQHIYYNVTFFFSIFITGIIIFRIK